MVIRLKLFIDEEKQKVVLAEAGKDFVDILFSFLTLPMGTIVRSIEKYLKSDTEAIGCFNNIYASVSNMEIKHFRTQACQNMLLYPNSLNLEKYQNLTLRIDDYEATKCFMCPNSLSDGKCSKRYSNFNSSRCSCGKLMTTMVQIDEEVGQVIRGNCPTSFIITDDLKVEFTSARSPLNVLKDLGYANCDNLVERIQEVNLQAVVTLLRSLCTSDTPLSDTFLKKSSSYGVKRIHKTLSRVLCEDRNESDDSQTIALYAYVNKKDGNILYAECSEDFVDLLFTFLAIPLESVWETSGDRSIFTCIGNLCRSSKELSADYGREAKCVLPSIYKCQNQLLNFVTTHKPPTYYRYVSEYYSASFKLYRFSENSGKKPCYTWDKLVPMIWIDPKSEDHSNTADETTTPTGGFVKKGIKFMVTDELSIKPLNLSSTVGLLKEKQIQFDDLEVKVISLRKEEAISLLEASMETSSALTTALLATESASSSDQQTRLLRTLKSET